jgi:hypothetical protein
MHGYVKYTASNLTRHERILSACLFSNSVYIFSIGICMHMYICSWVGLGYRDSSWTDVPCRDRFHKHGHAWAGI